MFQINRHSGCCIVPESSDCFGSFSERQQPLFTAIGQVLNGWGCGWSGNSVIEVTSASCYSPTFLSMMDIFLVHLFNSIQFYLYSAFYNTRLSQSSFTKGPGLRLPQSKPRAHFQICQRSEKNSRVNQIVT